MLHRLIFLRKKIEIVFITILWTSLNYIAHLFSTRHAFLSLFLKQFFLLFCCCWNKVIFYSLTQNVIWYITLCPLMHIAFLMRISLSPSSSQPHMQLILFVLFSVPPISHFFFGIVYFLYCDRVLLSLSCKELSCPVFASVGSPFFFFLTLVPFCSYELVNLITLLLLTNIWGVHNCTSIAF